MIRLDILNLEEIKSELDNIELTLSNLELYQDIYNILKKKLTSECPYCGEYNIIHHVNIIFCKCGNRYELFKRSDTFFKPSTVLNTVKDFNIEEKICLRCKAKTLKPTKFNNAFYCTNCFDIYIAGSLMKEGD